MSSERFESHLQAALALEVGYDNRNYPDLGSVDKAKAIPASVLVLFGYSQIASQAKAQAQGQGQAEILPSLLYTRRTEEVETHKGQIAFPGGHSEAGELNQPELTALRETEEEVGISRTYVKVLGNLPSLFTVSGFLIQPVVGLLNRSVEETSLVLDQQETAEVIWAPLQVLLSPGIYQAQSYPVGNFNYTIDVYQYGHHRIWGATGSITKNLLDRLNQIGTLFS